MSTSTLYPVRDPLPFCEVRKGTETFETPTTCYEAKDPSEMEDILMGTLYAEGMVKIASDVYPEEVHDLVSTITPYDEPLHPIPVGASIFYFIMIAWVTTFYFTYLGRKVLHNVEQKLDLHPDANRFPNLPLYWIQQSKREAEIPREVRNTWAWLARRYLLSPNDPLLANLDQVVGLVNWNDFAVSRNTWSLIKVILTVNHLYVKVRKDEETNRKSFEIVKAEKLANMQPIGDDQLQTSRVFEEKPDQGLFNGIGLVEKYLQLVDLIIFSYTYFNPYPLRK